MLKTRVIAGLTFAVAALVVTVPGEASTRHHHGRKHHAHKVVAQPAVTLSAAEARGLAFAKQRCSACHAVGVNGTSPNPESPPFQDIANRPGVTTASLRQFLSDSHNYPDAMNFRVEDSDIMDLAEYILTMKQAGYRPQI